MLASWELLCKGDTAQASARYEAAREIANQHGFRSLPIADVTNLPIEDLVVCLNATMTPAGKPRATVVASALLGTIEKSRLRVSSALDA